MFEMGGVISRRHLVGKHSRPCYSYPYLHLDDKVFFPGAGNVRHKPISEVIDDKEQNASNKVIEGSNQIAGVLML